MKNYLLVILFILVLGGGYYYFKSSPVVAPVTQNQPASETALTPNQTFDVKGLDYSYDIKEIKVKRGDVVKINFTNTEGFHDLKIDELSVATKQIKAGASESITFTADKIGTFEYYCSVGKHRANGMWGKLIVE